LGKNTKEKTMTLSQISKRAFIFAGAVLLGSTTTIFVPMAHAASGPYYQIELAKPVESKKTILRSVVVKCEGTSCRASQASTADKNMCISVASEFGPVTAFRAGDRAFDAAALEQCNGNKKVVKNHGNAARLTSN
jgi:hypothetical protein